MNAKSLAMHTDALSARLLALEKQLAELGPHSKEQRKLQNEVGGHRRPSRCSALSSLADRTTLPLRGHRAACCVAAPMRACACFPFR